MRRGRRSYAIPDFGMSQSARNERRRGRVCVCGHHGEAHIIAVGADSGGGAECKLCECENFRIHWERPKIVIDNRPAATYNCGAMEE